MQRVSIARNRVFLSTSYLCRTRAMNTTPTPSTSFLLTPTQASTLPSSSTKFLDTTWFMPNSPRNARQEFEKARIRGAKYFDLDEVASPNELGLKHMMPSSEQFKEACDQLGITKEDSVVLYDVHGVFSSPRALFTFKAFGHPKAFVLNGGLPAWRAAGLSVDESQLPSGEAIATGASGTYPLPSMDPSIIRSYEQMLENTKRESEDAELVLDARPKARFMGSAPEPRAGLPSGHMPNSVSIPFTDLLTTHEYSHDVPKVGNTTATYTTLMPPEQLRQVLIDLLDPKERKGSGSGSGGGAKGTDPEEESGRNGKDVVLNGILRGEIPIVASCGSGMTACVIWLALHELWAFMHPDRRAEINGGEDAGLMRIALYDESWTGYAMRTDSPIMVTA